MISMLSWQRYRTQTRHFAARYLDRPLARLLGAIGLSPNKISILGLLLSGVTAYVVGTGQFLGGGLLLLVASVLDMADGALARLTGKTTLFGGLLDSTADRISEAAVFLGLLVFYLDPYSMTGVLLVNTSLVGSFMVSYLRAKGESLGVECQVGIMTRPERVLVLAIGLLVDQVAIALWIIASLSVFTAVHRFWHIRGKLSER
jgi:CDP-diacylglycerol--glycerol-3-phosphate 3-phosphatidyltransferase